MNLRSLLAAQAGKKKADETPTPNQERAVAGSERRRKAREAALEVRRFFSGVGVAVFVLLLLAGAAGAAATGNRRLFFVGLGGLTGVTALARSGGEPKAG